jgi:hypothetical protein
MNDLAAHPLLHRSWGQFEIKPATRAGTYELDGSVSRVALADVLDPRRRARFRLGDPDRRLLSGKIRLRECRAAEGTMGSSVRGGLHVQSMSHHFGGAASEAVGPDAVAMPWEIPPMTKPRWKRVIRNSANGRLRAEPQSNGLLR